MYYNYYVYIGGIGLDQKCHAIVLRHADYGEYDRMVTLLTPEGLISASMKGCRRPSAKLRHASELFCFGEYILVRNGDRAIVKGCTMHDMFYPLREDLFKLTYASYMLSLTEVNAREDSPSELFFLLIHALRAMSYGAAPSASVLAFFLIKLTNICGYMPIIEQCALCGNGGQRFFSIANDGLVCRSCASTEAIELSTEAVESVKSVAQCGIEDAGRYIIQENDAPMLIEAFVGYISKKNERSQKSSRMVLELCKL